MSDPSSKLKQDHLSGASELVELAAKAMRQAVEEVGPSSAGLVPALRRVCHAQPTMAILQRLAARAILTARTAARNQVSDSEATGEIIRSIDIFVRDDSTAVEDLVEQTANELVPSGGWVSTYSRSSLVERALLVARLRGKDFQVLIGEGRPLLEGRHLATRLAKSEIRSWLTVDAGCGLFLSRADVLLVGADAIRPNVFVNKIGTYALLLTARELNVETYVLAQRNKYLPADAGLLEFEERSAGEVWESPEPGVQVRNPTFEEIPLSLIRGVMSESGLHPPGEAGTIAGEAVIPGELKEPWGSLPGEGS